MKSFSFAFFLVLFISFSLCSQNNETYNVTFFGSSVCNGTGAKNNHGYAWLLNNTNFFDTTIFKYYNASTGGDNTIKVEIFDRLTQKLYPTKPNIVVLGLSLGNEGILSPIDDDGREKILEQFRSRLKALADSLYNVGIKPVIVNCYAHTLFKTEQYLYTKKMNRIINTWEYPSVNVLGTIDDLSGKWVDNCVRDPWHPNDLGHEEMAYAFVPSLFEAIISGKKTPKYDYNPSYCKISNIKDVGEAISFIPEKTMHSFSLSFKFKNTSDGQLCGFTANNKNHNIIIDGFKLKYKGLSAIFNRHLNEWTSVVLSHSFANGKTFLFVNGEMIGFVDEQFSPEKIMFAGNIPSIDIKDIAIYRAALNNDEVKDLFNNKLIQSSLEFYNPMTKPIKGNTIPNKAQSLSILNIEPKVNIEFVEVNF